MYLKQHLNFTSDIIVAYASWLASEYVTASLISGLPFEGGCESRPSFRAATLNRRDSTVLELVLESKIFI